MQLNARIVNQILVFEREQIAIKNIKLKKHRSDIDMESSVYVEHLATYIGKRRKSQNCFNRRCCETGFESQIRIGIIPKSI